MAKKTASYSAGIGSGMNNHLALKGSKPGKIDRTANPVQGKKKMAGGHGSITPALKTGGMRGLKRPS